MSKETGNEAVDKSVEAALAEQQAAFDNAEKKEEEKRQPVPQGTTDRKYVRCIVRHATEKTEGTIYAACENTWFIKPDTEVVIPESVKACLEEAFVPHFDKEAKKQVDKPRFLVSVIETGLGPKDYQKFCKDNNCKVK